MNFSKMKHSILAALSIIFFASCEKVINVDLNDANPKIVIEAGLYEGTHVFKVHITKTISYFNNGIAPTIDNANVTLSDRINPAKTLIPVGDGWYELLNCTATNNTTYELNVVAEGKTYTASSYLPVSPVLDSLTYKDFGGGFGGGNFDPYLMTAHFQDSVGVANYYRLIVTKNDSLQNKPFDLFVFDDKIRDGQYIEVPVFSAFCDIGDTMDVELVSMDEKVYDYYITFGEIITGDANNSAAPANPNSNWSNKALGYFGAYSIQRKSIRIK